MIDFKKIAGFDWDKGNARKMHRKERTVYEQN